MLKSDYRFRLIPSFLFKDTIRKCKSPQTFSITIRSIKTYNLIIENHRTRKIALIITNDFHQIRSLQKCPLKYCFVLKRDIKNIHFEILKRGGIKLTKVLQDLKPTAKTSEYNRISGQLNFFGIV